MKAEVLKTMSIELNEEEWGLVNDVWQLLDGIEYEMNCEDIKEVKINDVSFDLETLQRMEELLYKMI